MKLTLLSFIASIILSVSSFSQENPSFYATMNTSDAQQLKMDVNEGIDIIATEGDQAAVYISEAVAHYLHGNVLVHGPGYIFKTSREDAIYSLANVETATEYNRMVFTITEDDVVNPTLDLVNTQNIEDHIIQLQNYGTRFHTRPTAIQAAEDLKTKWEAMAATYNRTDVSVRLYDHDNTPMPSVIMTIEGANNPDEFVIVGGHLDSTASPTNNDAPGADDDASGIATMTEAARALFEAGFVPNKTIEIMAYAAEEIGLVGSGEIAQEYSNTGVNVISAVQFDMTNYNGSTEDIVFITDFTDASLTGFLMDLIDHYNASGDHQFTYGTSLCNYGCSDHASWTNAGYMSAFPFEAKFADDNPNIHTANDVYSFSGNAIHATKFAKLCAEYLIEAAKSNGPLSVDQFSSSDFEFFVKDNEMTYSVLNDISRFSSIRIFDTLGKEIMSVPAPGTSGTVSLSMITSGIYIASLQLEGRNTINRKFFIK